MVGAREEGVQLERGMRWSRAGDFAILISWAKRMSLSLSLSLDVPRTFRIVVRDGGRAVESTMFSVGPP